ncbi:MAG: alpha-hydroxy acid oxidase [Pigmentiphaga sp.]
MHPRLRNKYLCLDDFETVARKRLPRQIYGYVSGASERNKALQDNVDAYGQYKFLTNPLRDTSRRSQAVTLLGQTYSCPVGIAPMGINALSGYRGDVVLAQAAEEAEVLSIMSGSSLIRMEDVARAAGRTWFQAYIPGDLPRIDGLLDRVEKAGFTQLVVTVDIPVMGNRENNIRAGFSTPLRPSLRLAYDGLTHPRWLFGTALRTLLKHGMPHFENSFATRGAPILSKHVERDFMQRDHLNWFHIRHIRQRWKGGLVVKGLLSPEDAVRAQAEGADGVVLSNHGGRQLDESTSALRVLPEVRKRVGKGFPLIIDGGIRRGTDVIKALALGADFTLIGRPFNYAMAAEGSAGVSHAIALIKSEIDRNMALLGLCSLSEASPALLVSAPSFFLNR